MQGAGHGVVTVRFETRASGPGQARTFAADNGDLTSANPVDSLDWPDYVGALRASEAAEDQPQRPMMSATGSPAASAAISSTRACGGASRGTITAPASAMAWPGP